MKRYLVVDTGYTGRLVEDAKIINERLNSEIYDEHYEVCSSYREDGECSCPLALPMSVAFIYDDIWSEGLTIIDNSVNVNYLIGLIPSATAGYIVFQGTDIDEEEIVAMLKKLSYCRFGSETSRTTLAPDVTYLSFDCESG